MIDLDFLQSLIRAMDESGLDSIEIERGGTRVRLSKSPTGVVASAPAPQPGPPAAQPPNPGAPGAAVASTGATEIEEESKEDTSHLVDVASPMVGTFYRSPAPDAPPYVEVGDRVAKGDTLCIIEAMKLMNELEAEISGTVAEIRIDNAEPVEYGQVLFRIDPS